MRVMLAPVVLPLLVAGCAEPRACPDGADEPAVAPAAPVGDEGFLPYGHAHNDYLQSAPLQDALALGLTSVEVDVFLERGDVVVKHFPWEPVVGSLRELYLDPLQERVDERGSVHGDGLPFHLWLDLKDASAELQDALAAMLDGYAMLTTFEPGGVLQGPVTVVLTGEAAAKEALVQRDAPRPYARDSNVYSVDDPPADDGWRFYALPWSQWIPWSGAGEPPTEAARRLACIVDAAHRDGRKLRFSGTPQTEESWDLQLRTGVDFVEADDVAALARFLEGFSP